MCNPGLLAVAGAAVSAAGQWQGALYASRTARYRADVAEANKARVREAANDAIAQGQEQQRQLGREVAATVGAQTARMAGNNTDITFGSAARTIEDTQMIGGEDSAAISENVRRYMQGHQTDLWNLESEKRAATAEAKQAKTAGAFSVATTLLGGATQYSQFKKQYG